MIRKIYRKQWIAGVLFSLMASIGAYAQTQVIKGNVSDPTGNAIPGVNVIIKGTTSGTATDGSGDFSIAASADDVLVFTFIGYKAQEVKVGSQTQLTIKMEEDVTSLEEITIKVGYGEAKRVDLTTAQTSVSSEDIGRTVNTTIEQAIQGRAAGVYITQNSGQPGGGISVNIRGINSINGTNEPLYVIDGVQIPGQSPSFGSSSSSNPLAGINPSDIESIEVLQGPSATAVYGSRATNGVLLITTKRGKAGDTRINYGFRYGVQSAPKSLKVMDLQQYAQMTNEYHALAGGNSPLEFLDPSLLGKGTDWQKELFKSAPMSNHQLSFSGGSDKITYYLSGEYSNQDGVALGSSFKRYSTRLNVDNKIKDWLSIGGNFSFNQTNDVLTTSQENIISNALQLTPQIPVKNFDGTWGGGDDTNRANQFAPVNPIAIANLTTNELVRRQFLGGLNLGVTLMKGLTFRSSFNTNVGFSNSTYFVPSYKFGYAVNPTASLTNSAGTNTYWNWNQLLEYNRSFGKHNINVMAMHEAQESGWKNISAARTGYVVNVLDLNIGDAKTATNGGGQGDWAMESYLGRLNYNYADKYILMGTLRADGSVNFGSNNKWGIFPSVSAAWRVSQEEFFQVPFINELKLRFETGLTGNQGGSGAIYSPLEAAPTQWGTGFLPSRYSNPGLKWESTKTNNVGLNLSVLDNRLQVEFDYYVKTTDNLLLSNPLPWYMGTEGSGSVGAPTVNIGSLQNKGWGITLTTVNVNRDGFKWETNFNASGFKTKILSFYSDAAFINRTSWWLQDWTQRSSVGRAPWQFLGYVEEGLFQSVDEINNSAVPADNNGNRLPTNETMGVWVGDVKFKDISGPNGTPDGIIDVYDQTFIGNPYPKVFGGITNKFSYKGFELSVLVTGTYGNDIYNYIAKVNTNPNAINLSRNMLVDAFNYAKVTTDGEGNAVLANPETNVSRISLGPNGNYARHTTRWVEDGSFLRLKNVTLTYNLPSALMAKQKIVRAARVSLSGQNLYTLTKYTGYDPEVGASVGRDVSAANQAIGLDNGRYPLTPVYSISIGVDF